MTFESSTTFPTEPTGEVVVDTSLRPQFDPKKTSEPHYFLNGTPSIDPLPVDGPRGLWPVETFSAYQGILALIEDLNQNPNDPKNRAFLEDGKTYPHDPWKTGSKRLWFG